MSPLVADFHFVWAETLDHEIDINTLDDPQAEGAMYLTVLGTSADGADGGEVGRGNRANGISSLSRPQSIEAHAGKNPVNHVGKIYSYFAAHVAQQIHSKVRGLREVYVELCSQMGRPIDDPMASSLKLVVTKAASFNDVGREAQLIFAQEVQNLSHFTSLLAIRDFYQPWEDKLLDARGCGFLR